MFILQYSWIGTSMLMCALLGFLLPFWVCVLLGKDHYEQASADIAVSCSLCLAAFLVTVRNMTVVCCCTVNVISQEKNKQGLICTYIARHIQSMPYTARCSWGCQDSQ